MNDDLEYIRRGELRRTHPPPKFKNFDIKQSRLGAPAGNGLFARKKFEDADRITEYKGVRVTPEQVKDMPPTWRRYATEITGSEDFLVACSDQHGPACFANSCDLFPQYCNAEFERRPPRPNPEMVATSTICPGDEILVKYGKRYHLTDAERKWAMDHMHVYKDQVRYPGQRCPGESVYTVGSPSSSSDSDEKPKKRKKRAKPSSPSRRTKKPKRGRG